MKILYVCHRIPYPPHKGEKIRSFHQVRHLARRHEVHLFALADRASDLAYIEPLRAFCREVEVVYRAPWRARLRALAALPFSAPVTLAYFGSSELRRRIRRAAAQIPFDVAVAYSSSMAPYIEGLELPRVVDFVDLDSQKWLQYASSSLPPWRWIYRLEGRRLFAFEKRTAEEAEAVIVVTEAEGEALREQGKPRRLEAVSLGVDLEFYRTEGARAPELDRDPRPTLLFVGFMAYRPNYEAVLRVARGILPGVAREVSRVRFVVVGADPPRAVRALHDGERIVVTGGVEDTRPYLRAASAALIPLDMGRGIQTKVLEAMAMKVPVVLSEQAARGVGGRPGRDYVVVRDDGEAVRETVRLLNDPERAGALGAAGRRFVEANYRWEDKLDRYERILEEVARGRSSKRGSRSSIKKERTSASGSGPDGRER